MSEVRGSTVIPYGEGVMKGWLLKWTNYLKGYQRRWFVLQNGHLSYYRNQAEMSHTCRGSISLYGALISTADPCTFVISNGATQRFHLRTDTEVERQCWLTQLELAKARAIKCIESEEDDDEETVDGCQLDSGPQECLAIERKLETQLQDLRVMEELVERHSRVLLKILQEIETSGGGGGETFDSNSVVPVTPTVKPQFSNRAKEVKERASVLRITITAFLNGSSEYVNNAQTHGRKWIRLLEHERRQRQQLQEMVETIAQQHSKLEEAATAHSKRPSLSGGGGGTDGGDDDDETEFYDAITDSSSTVQQLVQMDETKFTNNNNNANDVDSTQMMAPSDVGRVRRTSVPDKPNYPLNLWSIMKNCIGKDLSKIPMPVNFSEPLSMLQRLTEDYEYADVLHAAAKIRDPCEQLAYVAAFTISAYSTTNSRTGKPFNPLLGETFECDRRGDLGWRAISEQVSHHPPMLAQYCEGARWRCWQEFTMTSKFRGKYLQVIPLGTAHVHFLDSGNRFSWRKVTTTVHNIIVGNLWVDQHGEMDIVGRGPATKGLKCHLTYIPYSYFSRGPQRRVKGVVMDAANNVKWTINGAWDNRVDIAPVIGPATGTAQNPIYPTGPPITVWQRIVPAPGSERYYGFTKLAAQLNEMEGGVAPTDSRLRPDQHLMEVGQWVEANQEKVRLEEKQRAVRREREMEAEQAAMSGSPYVPYTPLWFEQRKEDDSDIMAYVFKGTYWKCKEKGDWSMCPNIF